jgi:tetratricopeptide (TPR) repeat protein
MDRERDNDRERLSGVHRSEGSTESRVNEEFVDWLKTKGPTYLLIGLAVLAAYLLWVNYSRSQETRQSDAWYNLQQAEISGMPSSFESVAEQYGNVDSIAPLARLRAAQKLIEAVQRNVPVGTGIDDDPDAHLPESERENYLARAERLYREVLEADRGRGRDLTLMAIKALNGVAAVAEARGDIEQAQSYYEQAAQRAERDYPHLAAQARRRAANADQVGRIASLPTTAERDAITAPDETARTPVRIDSAFRDMLQPGG